MVRVQEEEPNRLEKSGLFYFMAMFYIYFLYSTSSDNYYIGHSNDTERRLLEHNSSDFNTYTKKHRPWVLAYSFAVSPDRGDALKIERFIKKQKSRKLIQAIISEKKTLVDFKHLLLNSSAG